MSARISSEKTGDLAEGDQNNFPFNSNKSEKVEAIQSVDIPTKQAHNVRLDNPLLGLSLEAIKADVHDFVTTKGLEEHEEIFLKGALCAQVQGTGDFNTISLLSDEDRQELRLEEKKKWRQPFKLFWLAICCSVAAAIQGADESVINGAILFFPKRFHIDGDSDHDQWLKGLVSSAPYICCAFFSCWMAQPMNHFLGRRGTIFVSALIGVATCIWQAATNTWWHMFIARLFVGISIGPNSATVPIYAAECSPPLIRGALVMQWQTWTAFGIMLGNAASLALYKITPSKCDNGLSDCYNWRLMMASPCIPALFVMAQVYFCPESPRWLMKKGNYKKAWQSFLKLRTSPIIAARDMYLAHYMSEQEFKASKSLGPLSFLELFTIPRNLRATIASNILMFGQQFCGVNVIAYYSSSIIKSVAETTELNALLGSWGFGMINFLFAIPAWYTIDTFGRRSLLLFTLPFLSVSLLITGFAFWIDKSAHQDAKLGVVLFGLYFFAIFYSPGFGPVPLTYGAEIFPLHLREIGMGLSTAVLWFFNVVLSITWFRLKDAFKPQGAFGFYAAWCAILWVLCFLFVPETKALSLEELDLVFNVPTTKYISYQVRSLPYYFNRYILRKKNLHHESLIMT